MDVTCIPRHMHRSERSSVSLMADSRIKRSPGTTTIVSVAVAALSFYVMRLGFMTGSRTYQVVGITGLVASAVMLKRIATKWRHIPKFALLGLNYKLRRRRLTKDLRNRSLYLENATTAKVNF